MYLKFESIPRPVLLAQGLKLLPHLVRLFANWRFREVPAGRYGDPEINILQDGDDGIIQAPWIEAEQRYRNAADLADGLSKHLIRCWIEENAPALGIAAAAARFGDGLAVIIGGPKSGKSLLTASLSVLGHTVFADSVVPIAVSTRECIGLGMAPRLKLPLPASYTGPLRRRLERRLDSCGPQSAYLLPRAGDIAAFGERAPISAFVILDRADGSITSLRPGTSSSLLKRLLLGSFDALPSARATLNLLHDIVTNLPCYRLTWSDPSEAARTLRARLAFKRPVPADDRSRESASDSLPRRRAAGPRIPAGRRYRYADGLEICRLDGTMFIADTNGTAIYHLNSLGAGLWGLLDGTHGLEDVMSVLQNAYPTVDRTVIENDVTSLIAELVGRGLVIEQHAGDCGTERPEIIP
ncbi:MAG: PqqD family protein [Rhodospirillales bacterium]|nr:MAG: PqqD family protein [Rhodospirillales bacterium]